MALNDFQKKLKARQEEKNKGCPLFDEREKAELDDIAGDRVTLESAWPMKGKKGDYYVVVFNEAPDVYFFSCLALKNILDDAQEMALEAGVKLDDVIDGMTVEIGKKQRLDGGRDFRPVTIVD